MLDEILEERVVSSRGRSNVAAVSLVLLSAGAALGGEPEEQPASPPEKATVEGIVPLPEYAGQWRERTFLSGDWAGWRQSAAQKGLTFRLEWYQAAQGLVSGGVDERWAYGTNLDYYAKLDLMRLGVLDGALLSFRAQSRFGDSVNGDTGLLLPVNTAALFPFTDSPDEDLAITVTELTYTQFLSNTFAVILGKMTTLQGANEFAGGEGRSQFMNLQLSFPGVFAQVSPYSTLAASMVWVPTPNVTLSTSFVNTAEASSTTGLTDLDEGTTWVTSATFKYLLSDLPGGVTVTTGYAFNGDFSQIGGLNRAPGEGFSLASKGEAWAVFASGWQYLKLGERVRSVNPTDGRQDLRGLGAFLTVGAGDRDTNPAPCSVAVGLAGRAAIPSRVDDTWGVGYFYNDLRDFGPRRLRERLGNSTQGLEAYYSFALTVAVAFTCDFQWTKSAFGRVDDSAIFGFRLTARL